MQETMGKIRRLRKGNDWTQEELAIKLGVTSQAISKWENDSGTPDISILPLLADTFGVYIDNLFGRYIEVVNRFDLCTEFPWADDGGMREVLCNGRKKMIVEPIG